VLNAMYCALGAPNVQAREGAPTT